MQRTTKVFLTYRVRGLDVGRRTGGAAAAAETNRRHPATGRARRRQQARARPPASARSSTPTSRPRSAASSRASPSRSSSRTPRTSKIEAVYIFPLPDNAAVDDMTMKVGDRTVEGTDQAARRSAGDLRGRQSAGHVAALLDQERPEHLHPVGRQHRARRAGQDRDQLRRDA